jgi:Tol biopolymer transport system component
MRSLILAVALLASTSAQAFDLSFLSQGSKPKPSDSAEMMTLESKQTEMYPQVSPDNRYLLVVAQESHDVWLSRRAINGDPLNALSHDAEAAASAAWHNDEISFLSHRAGGEGMWAERADGQGLLHRVRELSGHLTQTRLLKNGSLIAVRLLPNGQRNAGMGRSHDDFVNWAFPGYEPYIVRIDPDGAEHRLSQGVNPAISPDGQWIAFALPVGRSFHVCVMRIDGSELTELTQGRATDVQPAWMPNGKQLVFASDRVMQVKEKKGYSRSRAQWNIWMIDRHGANLARVTADEGRDGAPSVALDGSIYFHSDRKVDAGMKKRREIRGNASGFHIWRIRVAEKAAPSSN